jgi:2-dehydro-3-deoxyphosphogluconate aldolase/(4S)-4-hydroxy-2-oxoglutarate aldolase
LRVDEVLAAASVIPVLEVEKLSDAAPLARALAEGGLRVVELTLRTACALDALGAMKAAAPSLIVGMGTVRTAQDIAASRVAGAEFLVSPGASRALLEALAESGLPALPGVATASEAMEAADAGFRALKFFPAEPAGGAPYLKSLAGPLPDLRFCPTGGVTPANAAGYFAIPSVACVGGSWIATRAAITEGRFAEIARLAAEAHALKPKR